MSKPVHKDDGGFPLPEVIDPPRIKFCIEIPDEDNHIRAFWGALWDLTRWFNWEFDDEKTGKKVADVWFKVWLDNHENWRERGCGMSEECCDDITTRLEEQLKRFDRIIELIEGGFTIVPLNAGLRPPDEAGGDCAPDHFDHNGDGETPTELEQRRKALCITVERYIKSIFLKVLVDMNSLGALVDFISAAFPQPVPLSLADLTVVYPNIFSGLSAFFAAMGSGFDFSPLICAMVDGLSGDKNNTFLNFKNSLNDYAAANPTNEFVALIAGANGVKANYKAFNKALNDAYNEDLAGYECPCVEPPVDDCGEIPLSIVSGGGGDPSLDDMVITPLGDNLYRFEQPTPLTSNPSVYVITFKDALDRCMKIEATESDTQAVNNYELTGCASGEGDCFSENSTGTGGFTPATATRMGVVYSTAVNTVYRITCCVPTP